MRLPPETAELPTAELNLSTSWTGTERPAPGPPPSEADAEALPDSSVRAIVIDAHAPSRIGLAALLDQQPWIDRCLLAADSTESVALTRRHHPDVAILDVSQTGPFAGTVTAAIRAAHPGLQILLISRCRTTLGAPPASLGAIGFLPAGVSGEDVVAAVRAAVISGEPLDFTASPPAGALELSDREREILVLLGTGATNREIAARLHLGPDSVKKTATALYRKLGVRNRTEAAQRAATVLSA
jgi:two-component system response regulator DesR